MRDVCVVIFTKPAVPGRVKTRLVGELTEAQAAELHRSFLDDVVENLGSDRWDLRLAWAVEPGEPLPREPAVPGFAQRGHDLGARLDHGLREVASGRRVVVAVGSDHPELPAERVHEAVAGLGADEVAIGPADDGGFYLVAVPADRLDPRLFADVEWSTEATLRHVERNCRALGRSVRRLEPANDVDRPDDLERLEAGLRDGSVHSPRTRAVLQSWGRLAGGA